MKIDAKFRDWEDIATDSLGRLYLADVGNNSRQHRHMTVYRIDEPDPASPKKIEVAAAWRLAYPDRPFNCESFFILDGHGYVISKLDPPQRAVVYRFTLSENKKHQTLERVCELPIADPVTAADITADGRSLAVLSNHALSLFQIDGDVRKSADAAPRTLPVPPVQAEGCCFNPEGVLIIAESGEIFQFPLDAPAATLPTQRAH
jgi:hypothetical protein